MWETLRGLSKLPVEITLVAPVSDEERATVEQALRPVCRPELVSGVFHRRPSWPRIASRFLLSLAAQRPMSAWRHRNDSSRERVRSLLSQQSFDLIHVEQPQAFEAIPPIATPPVFLRAQNVESDLWRDLASQRGGPLRWVLRWEAKRLARWEANTLERAQMIAAVSREDRARLTELANLTPEGITYVPAPFPAPLPDNPKRLEGDPALVVFGGSGWLLSELGVRQFVERLWADVARDLPGAQIHIFGAPIRPRRSPSSVHFHPAPYDSRDVFARDAVLLVPLQVSSGVRIKILEAWARSCAVVASRVAAQGLSLAAEGAFGLVEDSNSAAQWVAALKRVENPDTVAKMRQIGLTLLEDHHAPEAIAEQLLGLYRQMADRHHEPLRRGEQRPEAAQPEAQARALDRGIGNAAFEAD